MAEKFLESISEVSSAIVCNMFALSVYINFAVATCLFLFAQSEARERRALDILEEVRERWRSSDKDGQSSEGKMAAMEAKCEALEEKLADAR